MSLHQVERELTGAIAAQVQRQHDQGFHFGCSHRMSVIDEMEAWLLDCGYNLGSLSAESIALLVDRLYDGGVNQFVADQCQPGMADQS